MVVQVAAAKESVARRPKREVLRLIEQCGTAFPFPQTVSCGIKKKWYHDLIKCCAIPGCSKRRFVVHHVIPLRLGGPDCFGNFILLCHSHHRHFELLASKGKAYADLLAYKRNIEMRMIGTVSYTHLTLPTKA